MSRVLLAERSTGFVHLTVHEELAGFRWSQTPGPDRPAPVRVAGPALLRLLPDTSATGAAWVGPERRGATLEFLVGGPVSLLGAAATPGGLAVARRGLAATGRALRMVHDVRVPRGTAAHPPAGPHRLAAWLGDGRGPRAAARLRTALGLRFGPDRLDTLGDWARAALAGGRVLVHGGPSLGQIVPCRGGPTAVLGGEGPTAGEPALDLGWLLGELTEIGRGGTRPWVAPLGRALLAGYGPAAEHLVWPAACRFAAVRMATHLHDFAAYVGWDDDLPARLDLLATLVDDPLGAVATTLSADHDRPTQELR